MTGLGDSEGPGKVAGGLVQRTRTVGGALVAIRDAGGLCLRNAYDLRFILSDGDRCVLAVTACATAMR
jgi:hypothetical protein